MGEVMLIFFGCLYSFYVGRKFEQQKMREKKAEVMTALLEHLKKNDLKIPTSLLPCECDECKRKPA